MKYESMVEIIKDGEIVIPMYLYKLYPSLGISLESFIFLMYLRSKGDMIEFDIEKLSKTFGIDNKTIMKFVGELEVSK